MRRAPLWSKIGSYSSSALTAGKRRPDRHFAHGNGKQDTPPVCLGTRDGQAHQTGAGGRTEGNGISSFCLTRSDAIGVVLLSSPFYQAVAADLPPHSQLRVLIVSDGVNPHGLPPDELTEPGDISAALLDPATGLKIDPIGDSVLEIPSNELHLATAATPCHQAAQQPMTWSSISPTEFPMTEAHRRTRPIRRIFSQRPTFSFRTAEALCPSITRYSRGIAA